MIPPLSATPSAPTMTISTFSIMYLQEKEERGRQRIGGMEEGGRIGGRREGKRIGGREEEGRREGGRIEGSRLKGSGCREGRGESRSK